MWRRVLAAVSDNATEIGLLLGLVCVTAGLWPAAGWLSLIVPGGVLMWICLPVRRRFIESSPGIEERKGKS